MKLLCYYCHSTFEYPEFQTDPECEECREFDKYLSRPKKIKYEIDWRKELLRGSILKYMVNTGEFRTGRIY